MSLNLSIHEDADAVARAAVELLEAWGAEAIAGGGWFVLSLAGGATPRGVYRMWGESSHLDWTRVILLYGDERCVPPEHPDSNHGMVRETLLDKLPAQPTVHRMAGENPDPQAAAQAYENVLDQALGPLHNGLARIDVALLGIGGDGHTASLFPHSPALEEKTRQCVATHNPAGQERLTVTLPVLRRARRLMFLAAGKGKAEILHRVVEGEMDPVLLPSQTLLRDDTLECHLVLDRAAAEMLAHRDSD